MASRGGFALIGGVMIGTGSYLAYCAVTGTPPLAVLKDLLRDPSDVVGTFAKYRGEWNISVDGSGGTSTGGGVSTAEGVASLGKNAASSAASAASGRSNGRLAQSDLAALSWNGVQVAKEAKAPLEALNAAFKAKFGKNLNVNGGYRTYERQVSLKREKPVLAAKPGTSNHGWGLAVDLSGIGGFNSAEYKWLAANAPQFGIVNPSWAQAGGSKPEYWHWEIKGASNQ